MTFYVKTKDESYYIDIETMDDLALLADKHGWAKMIIDMWDLTITIE